MDLQTATTTLRNKVGADGILGARLMFDGDMGVALKLQSVF